ncbi:FecCD family ABC transporter permease [Kaistia nematophila]|uniref:Iron chelate uptake ABC transporter family permease subunit n=1 Tax=Kaistia nematophila TaxID=2994654 RepID=A0A9X3IJU5_9HYPH|nr:iron chelate uptake ABC transporter family permease subunit [Kaistia nematophila]MCX5567801.1 iron chelate uptake ABC transporter family permease subunit [Kaistia nematophila]
MTAPIAGDRRGRARVVTAALVLLLLAVCVISVCVGPSGLSTAEVAGLLSDALAGRFDAINTVNHVILFDIRIPRTLLGAMVGAALALAGAMMQGLFRNPLADPGLVGVSAGAALGAVLVIVLGGAFLAPVMDFLGIGALPIAAFFGGLGTTLLLYSIATRRGQTSVGTMLLAGIALGAIAGAITAYLVFRSNDFQLRELTFWSMGGLGGATWHKILLTLPFVIGVFIAMPFTARGLDALVLGEAEARHLGFNTQFLKSLIILVVALAVGVSVAFAGIIGFVGIVVPHVLRLVIGPEHRTLLPATALLGATLLIVADMVCRTIVAPAELPIGIVTATIGAPFFLSILLRKRGVIDL